MKRRIEIELDTPVGPCVRTWGDWTPEEIEAQLPNGWTVGDNWQNQVRTDSGGYAYPLVRSTSAE